MQIVNTKEMLANAQKGRYAVGAFNIENMEFAQAVIEAAEELRSPVILATSVNTLKYADPNIFISIVTAICDRATVPVSLHLDHGEQYFDVLSTTMAGYKSVMIDGSKKSYSDNLELTKKVVSICKPFDISVEGELGAIGGKPGDKNIEELMYTNPETAKDFVEKTGVDSLAVAIGTAHGIYKSTPKLDIDRLDLIRDKIDVPLVLHGASGLSNEQINACITHGICKINIATELRIAWTNALRECLQKNVDKYDPKVFSRVAREEVKEIVKEKIIVCGSKGKADEYK